MHFIHKLEFYSCIFIMKCNLYTVAARNSSAHKDGAVINNAIFLLLHVDKWNSLGMTFVTH